jgi:murein DD-endopeptidase MepM/ murein hydrolase activator NlpD
MPGKRISLIVIPAADGQVHEFRFPRWVLWLGCLAAMGLLVALVFFASGFMARADQYAMVSQLQAENSDLVRGLQLATQELASLEERMELLAADDDRLRAYHQMEPLSLEERMGGVGGSEELPEDYTALPAQKRALLDDLRGRIFRLKQETRIQQASFAHIQKRYAEHQGELRHYPTISPVPRDKTWISSSFGYRTDPFTGKRAFHSGIDFAGRLGTPVFATADGVVTHAYKDLRLGLVIVVEHDILERNEQGEEYEREGVYRTEYGHLNKILVQTGQRVERGQKIGEMGNTGRSTGPHLHYSVRYQDRRRGQYKGYEDPQYFLLDEVPRDSRVANWVPAEAH